MNFPKSEGFPKCQPYWPPKQRDASVAACIRFLEQYSDRCAYSGAASAEDSFHERAHFRIPRLDHPATDDDLHKGLAIFTLPGKARVLNMPQFPMKASWTTLKDRPSEQERIDAGGGSKKEIYYNTNGVVWQAEEAWINGKWKRFFGFVGPYRLEKVPASEIEFPAKDRYCWIELPSGRDVQISGPEVVCKDGNLSIVRLVPGRPLPVRIRLRTDAASTRIFRAISFNRRMIRFCRLG